MSTRRNAILVCATLVLATSARAGEDELDWETGEPELASAGALAFGPEGVLFVGDAAGAAVFAFDTGDVKPSRSKRDLNVKGFDETLAYLLGTTREEIAINDLAVNPVSGSAYLSLTRGGGDDARPALVRVNGPEEIEVLELDKLPHMRASLENAPPPDDGGRRSRRSQSITDLEYHDGMLYVAGLSNEEFASKLRAMAFPFGETGPGTSIEIYHAAHGAWETRSPVRTFLPIDIGGAPHLLCGYTCTPLVKVPVERIAGGERFLGTTVAELGNRNTPLDMVLYEKSGTRHLLIANTSRGVMKLAIAGIEDMEGLTTRVESGGRAGLEYETIESLADVTQLARIDEGHALVLVETDAGAELETVELP